MIYCVSLENMIEPAPRIIQVNIVVPNCIAASIYVDSTTLSLAYATSFEQSFSHAMVASIKFTKWQSVSELVRQ